MTKATNINLNEEESATQMDMILEALLLGEKLTVLDGVIRFKCLSLSQRVSDLNLKHGWDIKSRYITVESGKKVKEYSLYAEFK
jgi:hypothetical protein